MANKTRCAKNEARDLSERGARKPKQKALVAPVYSRFKAFVIDTFIILMPILYAATYFVLGGREAFLNNQFAIFVCNALFGVISSAFFAINAQTPGYKAQQIYLISLKTGRKIGFFHALIRYFCFAVAGFSVAGLLLCFFRKDRLNLHDILTASAPVARKI